VGFSLQCGCVTDYSVCVKNVDVTSYNLQGIDEEDGVIICSACAKSWL
jgi:hypothetical protein